MNEECCNNCYFWKDVKGGSCHWGPPTLFFAPNLAGGIEGKSAWPPIAGDKWCGQWKMHPTLMFWRQLFGGGMEGGTEKEVER